MRRLYKVRDRAWDPKAGLSLGGPIMPPCRKRKSLVAAITCPPRALGLSNVSSRRQVAWATEYLHRSSEYPAQFHTCPSAQGSTHHRWFRTKHLPTVVSLSSLTSTRVRQSHTSSVYHYVGPDYRHGMVVSLSRLVSSPEELPGRRILRVLP